MTILFPIIYRFGEIKKEVINQHEKDHFYYIVTSIMEDNCVWISDYINELSDLLYTIPVSKKQAQDAPDFIAERFINLCDKNIPVLKEANSKIALLVDVEHINRELQVYHLSNAFHEFFAAEISNQVNIILLVDSLPSQDDALYVHIFSLMDNGRIVLVDRYGNLQPKKLEKNININQYRELSKYRTEISIEKLQRKLIKKIGHFRAPKGSMCSRYFYDARYCQTDIIRLTLDFITSNISKDSFEFIVYPPGVSRWLLFSISALSGDIEKDFKDRYSNYVGAYNIETLSNSQSIAAKYKGGSILLITDIIYRGETIKDTIVGIEKLFPNSISNLKCLTILTAISDNNAPYTNVVTNTRIVKIKGQEYPFKYFIGVDVQEDSQVDCDLCRLGIKHDELNIKHDEINEGFLRLKSYYFWELADKYKYVDEEIVPLRDNRYKLPLTPDFKEWIVNNSPYLAYKFRELIKLTQVSKTEDFVVIFPDESTGRNSNINDIYDSVTGKFAATLNELFDINIIGIPRSIIDAVAANRLAASKISNSAKWCDQIYSLPPGTDIILVDEMHVNGGTFEAMIEILDTMHKEVKCYFTLVDFNPDKTKKYNKVNTEFINLYEFNYTEL